MTPAIAEPVDSQGMEKFPDPKGQEFFPDPLATVGDKMSLTFAEEMTQVARTVIKGVRDFAEDVLPQIITLKDYFDTADRDSSNRLRIPILECSTWQDFCEVHLKIHIRKVQRMIAATKPPKAPKAITGESIAECEREHPGIQQFAQRLLAQLPAADVIGTLVAQYDVSEAMAESIVKRVTADSKIEEAANAGESAAQETEPVVLEATRLTELFRENNPSIEAEVTPSEDGRFHLTLKNMTAAEIESFKLEQEITA